MPRLLLLGVLVAACTNVRPQAAEPSQMPAGTLPTALPARTAAPPEGNTPPAEPTEAASSTPNGACLTHDTTLQLSPSDNILRVGEMLTLTATLTNDGCAMIGLPLYRLVLVPGEPAAAFEPAKPEPVEHYLGLDNSMQDTSRFDLLAAAAGEAGIQVTVSFEVHLGYPGPAYWGTAASPALRVVVKP